MNVTVSSPAPKRLFISYRRGSADNAQEGIIRRLYEHFSVHHDMFTDKDIRAGDRWGEYIEAQINACDLFIPLLTSDAIWSEMVIDGDRSCPSP